MPASLYRLLLFLAICCFPLGAFAAAGAADVLEDDPGLFLAMGLMLAGFVIIMAVMLAISTALVLLLGLFAATGVLSLSIIIGWRQRSVSAFVRWFFRLSFTGGGVALGLVLVSLVFTYKNDHSSYPLWLIIAIISGAFAGWAALTTSKYAFRILLRLLAGSYTKNDEVGQGGF